MDKDTRNRIQSATQAARGLLEQDFADQLAGVFDIRLDGTLAAEPGSHLDAAQRVLWRKLMAAVDHHRASGQRASEAVATYLREAAFTTLNRFVALKMLEARGLVQECVSRGEQSAGFKEFCGLAPGLVQLPDHGYRLYIESLFDELSTEVKVLFDRRDPASVLWPKRATFERLLEILNDSGFGVRSSGFGVRGSADRTLNPELSTLHPEIRTPNPEPPTIWDQDETIGWVYQFFNGQDERRKMREESQAPRNSRELAVRNQFFTPRYVVQFLTDNTLGRIWYEMRGTQTALADQCEYMVRKPGETFAPRAKKDPRDLRVLDPACGSGHFLLYAFDLLLTIYEEAHADPESPRSEATGRTLAADYPSLDALRKALPGLVLAHNLYGVDIDPRCAQIAQLALWMRAQRAYREFGIGRAERPQIRRSNIVVAEPLVADEQIAKEFVAKLGDPELGRVFMSLVESLSLAGDLGLLLRVEQLVARKAKRGQTSDLFAPPEERIRAALDQFVGEEASAMNTRRRLFADDAAHAAALLSIAEKKFDVVLMNPPFGAAPPKAKLYIDEIYSDSRQDLFAVFVARAADFVQPRGRIGYLGPRTVYFAQRLASWRRRTLIETTRLLCLADLGLGVLDAALVDVAAGVLEQGGSTSKSYSFDTLASPPESKGSRLRVMVGNAAQWTPISPESFLDVPGCKFVFGAPPGVLAAFRLPKLDPSRAVVREGPHTADNDRFVRLWWEVPIRDHGWGADWPFYAKGGEYAPFWSSPHLMLDWRSQGRDIAEGEHSVLPSKHLYGRSGLTYTERTASVFNARVLPAGSVFSQAGPAIIPEKPGDAMPLLVVVMSMPVRAMLEFVVGTGDAGASGGVARHFLAGTVGAVPVPPFSKMEWALLDQAGCVVVNATRRMRLGDEMSLDFVGINAGWSTLIDGVSRRLRQHLGATKDILEASSTSEQLCIEKYGWTAIDVERCAAVAASNPWTLPRRRVAREELAHFEDLEEEALVNQVAFQVPGRATIKLSYYADRRVELACRALDAHPIDVIEAWPAPAPRRAKYLAWRTLSVLVGFSLGRWKSNVFTSEIGSDNQTAAELLQVPQPPKPLRRSPDTEDDPILVDDEGHPADVAARLEHALAASWLAPSDNVVSSCLSVLGAPSLRVFLRERFFSAHLAEYSQSRRRAPIYWQLATSSASYSVWLYIHAFSKDTLFRVQNDYVAPKLAHEERRLEALTTELRDGATATQRKELAAQEAMVEELRAFLGEVRRVAPLWKPDLDDGVIINFAPLWRLVPQNKSWQKELKSTWDSLCEGRYDWAHLAMHLWPERVVPKCATDRSLAIAHGLEDVFWEESSVVGRRSSPEDSLADDRRLATDDAFADDRKPKTDDARPGKWLPCTVAQVEVDRLIAERTSAAVKDALNSLLEAPAPVSGRKSSGRVPVRRAATAPRSGNAGPGSRSPTGSVAPDPAMLDAVKQAIAAAQGGTSKSEVLTATGLTDAQWTLAINALLTAGTVTKTGAGRGTRYHLNPEP